MRYRLSLLLTAAIAVLGAPSAPAQVAPPFLETVDALAAELEAATDLAEEERASLEERLKGARRDFESADRFAAQLAGLEEQIERSAALVARYDRQTEDIERAPATLQSRIGADPSLADIEGEIAIIEGQRGDWTRERAEVLDTVANLARSTAELRDRLADLNAEDDEAENEDAEIGESSLGKRIEQLAISAHTAAVEAERKLVEARLRGAADLNAIRTAKIRWLDVAISEADNLLLELREAAAASRENVGDQRRAETRRLLTRLSRPNPEVEAFAQGNLALIDEFQTLSRHIEKARSEVARTRELRETIDQDSQLTQRRLEVTGLEAELGDVMLSRLASLPGTSSTRAETEALSETIAQISSAAIDTEQELRSVIDRQTYLDAQLGSLIDFTETETAVAEGLVEQRRTLLAESLEAQNTLLRVLVDENQAYEALAAAADAYRTLLTGNLLWVRNYSYARPSSLERQLKSLFEFPPVVDLVGRWPYLAQNLYFVLSVLALVVVVFRQRAARAALDAMLGVPIRPRDESAALIAKGLALTLIAALLLPLILTVSGFALTLLAEGNASLETLGKALYAAAVVFYFLSTLRRMAGRLGVGRRLLKWNSPRADLIINDLNWFTPTLTVAAAIQVFGRNISPTESGGALAAMSSLTMAMSLFLLARHMLRSGLFNSDLILRTALRAGLVLSFAIAVMHLSGQLFAAHLYLRALVLSIAAIVATLLIANVLQRVLIIYRMDLERKTRQEQRAKEAEDNEAETEDGDPLEAVSSLSAAYTQLLVLFRLLTLGALLWLIWSPALPALDIFDSVTLWQTADPRLPPGEMLDITISVVLLAVVVIVTTILLTKHVPPLLNVLLLEWTQVSAGGRYAAGMLLQYLIIGVGLSSAMAMLGFQWSKVQWLVAALGVGIGFGLQEIVANFISGLIVLFERPIRVGDIINAGGHDGTVVNINPRATVIETFEGKEVMIPNKELITNVVTNWSLSSSKLRIVVPVGIAYGSDVEDATERLLRIANAHPDILREPAAFVTFEDFGDNALILWLRCYALKDYLGIATALRREIYRDFNDAGIGIAFPQRDIHLDASGPLPVRILRDDGADDDNEPEDRGC